MRVSAIGKSFQPLYGQLCWGLHYDRQLNLSMNFGKPSLEIREPFQRDSADEIVREVAALRGVTVRGEWWLWIYCCYWRVTSRGSVLATGSASIRRIERAMLQLRGQKLVSVEIVPQTGATRFAFDLGGALECRRFEKETDDELWTLYKPSGYVLSVYGNGTYTHQRSSESAQRFRPIEDNIRTGDRES